MEHLPLVLLILDGYGLAPAGPGNAIRAARTPVLDALMARFPHSRLSASGLDVGLPEGQFGNSEVGHTNLGAGRVVYQDLTRINRAIEEGDFDGNPALLGAVTRCAGAGAPALHLMGLLSDGGVHSHTGHLYALLALAERHGVGRVFVHAFTDGRDTPPTSGLGYLEQLRDRLAHHPAARLASVCGRYYAMDRDRHWERLLRAYNCLVQGEAERPEAIGEAVLRHYDRGVTDEFLPPMRACSDGRIEAGDSVIFFNFRPDRARELTRALIQPDFDGFARPQGALPLCYACMAQYDQDFLSLPFPPGRTAAWPDGYDRPLRVAYPPQDLGAVLGQVASTYGLRQLRLAETEKYAHVTCFFNGGRETVFPGEDRILVPSPRVATYDLQPEMSAPQVAAQAAESLREGRCDLLICNLANCDMVGHTGVFEAAVRAVEAVDAAVGVIVGAALEMGGLVLLTADHGNADDMLEPDGSPRTTHSTNPVPFAVIGLKDPCRLRDGRLCDVAPTLLELIGLPKPPQMTGESLLRH
ncbi:MAG: 2,3-bisphosphoglycerate-independent phosphoglycerate mutase [Clostridiales bacterium]|nr:2,3-bisphosphoglycerate-independent phosphoglycerate mutase [Clostridiales bacterium]